jgi:serine/threonine protein kinase
LSEDSSNFKIRKSPTWKKGELMDGKFKLKKYIGSGGMGEVWLVDENKGRKNVVLKIQNVERLLKLDILKESDKRQYEYFVKRSYEEAKALLELDQHPNIITVYDIQKTKNSLHIICEYSDLGNLKDLIKTRKIRSWKSILTIAIQICAGMSYAHKNEFIHRDLKPENILISSIRDHSIKKLVASFLTPNRRNGSKEQEDIDITKICVKVADFGLVKKVIQEEEKIRTSNTLLKGDKLKGIGQGTPIKEQVFTSTSGSGIIIGTPSYMSPEQWDSSFGNIGKDTDFYSFGLLLFELITGGIKLYEIDDRYRNAHQGLKIGLYRKLHCEDPMPDIKNKIRQSGVMDCPLEIVSLIEECLKKTPSERFRKEKECSQFRYFETIEETLVNVYSKMVGQEYLSSKIVEKVMKNIPYVLNESDYYLKKARHLCDLEAYEEALIAYDKVINIGIEQGYKPPYDIANNRYPYHASREKGKVLMMLGLHEEAILAYDKIVSDKRYFLIGKVYEVQGLYDTAVELYNIAFVTKDLLANIMHKDYYKYHPNMLDEPLYSRRDSADVIYFYYKGKSLAKSQEYEEAITAFDTVIEIKNEFHMAYKEKCEILFMLGRYEEALIALDKAIENNHVYDISDKSHYSAKEPIKSIYYSSVFYNYTKGKILDILGRHKEAVLSCEKAVMEEFRGSEYYDIRDITDLYFSLAVFFEELGRYEEALIALDKAIENNRGCEVNTASATAYEFYDSTYFHTISMEYESTGWDPQLRYQQIFNCEKAMPHYEYKAKYYSAKGNILEKLKRYEEARMAHENSKYAEKNYNILSSRKESIKREIESDIRTAGTGM